MQVAAAEATRVVNKMRDDRNRGWALADGMLPARGEGAGVVLTNLKGLRLD